MGAICPLPQPHRSLRLSGCGGLLFLGDRGGKRSGHAPGGATHQRIGCGDGISVGRTRRGRQPLGWRRSGSCGRHSLTDACLLRELGTLRSTGWSGGAAGSHLAPVGNRPERSFLLDICAARRDRGGRDDAGLLSDAVLLCCLRPGLAALLGAAGLAGEGAALAAGAGTRGLDRRSFRDALPALGAARCWRPPGDVDRGGHRQRLSPGARAGGLPVVA